MYLKQLHILNSRILNSMRVALLVSALFSSFALQARVILTKYVTPGGAGNKNGTSWANAYDSTAFATNLRSALSPTNFRVAAGTYRPRVDTAGVANPTDHRRRTFYLKKGVSIYGGYSATDSTQPRNAHTYRTILTGDIDSINYSNDNCYHILFVINSDSTSTIDGLVFTRAVTHNYVSSITDLTVYYGGGIFMYNSVKVNISNCEFSDNNAFAYTPSAGAAGRGGGIYLTNSNPVITQCVFLRDTAQNGGAIYYSSFGVSYTGTTMNKCIFSGNNSSYGNDVFYGGNMSKSVVTNCVFNETINKIESFGNQNYTNATGTLTYNNCTFNNSTLKGLNNSGACKIVLNNCIVWYDGNQGSTYTPFGNNGTQNDTFVVKYSDVKNGYTGTGNINSDPQFLNSTSTAGADGVYGTADDGLTLLPCSHAKDSGSNSLIPSGVSTDVVGNSRIYNSGVVDMGAYEYQGSNGTVVASVTITASSTGTICTGTSVTFTAAPTNGGSFPTYVWKQNLTTVSTSSAYITSSYNNGDSIKCILTSSTACASPGTATSNKIVLSVKKASTTTVNATIYIGHSYTFNGSTYATTGTYTVHLANSVGCDSAVTLYLKVLTPRYVTPGGVGSKNGTSWANAYDSTAFATNLRSATNNTVFFVAAGTYRPRVDTAGVANPTDHRKRTFYLKKGVSIYGGYSATDSTQARNWHTYRTILTGDIDSIRYSKDNCYHILFCINSDSSSTIDGLVFTRAVTHNYSSSITDGSLYNGGGIFMYNSDKVNISNCEFSDNNALAYTPGVGAAGRGGGIYLTNSNPVITQCVFLRDTAQNGGAIYYTTFGVSYTGTTMNKCIFSGNNSSYGNDVFYTGNMGKSVVTNCVFNETLNKIESTGNQNYLNATGTLTYNNCTFNNSTLKGQNYSSACKIVLNNCIVWYDGNQGSTYTPIGNNGTQYDTFVVKYSDVKNGYTGTGNINSDPHFLSSTSTAGVDGIYGTADDGLSLLSCSHAIDSASNSLIPSGVSTDVAGNSRIYNSGVVDMGAYEYQGAYATYTPTISIAASPGATNCAGTSVTFTPTITNGGNTPAYSWIKNTSTVSTGSTYTTGTFNNGDTVKCILTSSLACASPFTAKSNTIALIVKAKSTSSVNAAICPGGSYSFNGTAYTSGGTYTAHLTNSVGCDSVVTLTLTVKSISSSSVSASICPGASYSFNGSSYTTSGTYTAHLTNKSGCDSVVTLYLTVKNTSSSSVSAAICPGGSYSFNGTSYTSGGTYTAHLTNSVGCDSVVTLTLTVKSISSSSVSASICPGASYSFNGSSYTTGGTYTATLTNSAGCDSVVTLHLTITSTVTPAVSINASPGAATCPGTSVTFTATPTNGGSTPAYQWKKGSSNVGTNSNTYTVSAFNNGDTVYAILTSAAACASPTTATSNSIIIGCTPTAGFTSNASICNNGAAAILPVKFTGTGPWHFKYTDGSTTYGPVTATASPYNLMVTPTATATYTLVSVNNGLTGTIGTYSSRTVNVISGGNVTPGASNVCNDSSQTFTLVGSVGSTIQWQYAINSDTSIGGWTNFGTNATSATLSAITATKYVRTIVSTPGCAKVSSTTAQVNADATTLNLTVNNITPTSAVVSWNIIIGATYSITVNGVTTTSVTSPYTVSLNACASNAVSVSVSSASCPASPTSGSTTITTPPAPLVLSAVAGSGTKIVASWTGGVGPYKFYYNPTTSLNTYTTVSVTGSTYTIAASALTRTYIMYVVDLGSTCTPKAQSNYVFYNTGTGGACTGTVPTISGITAASSTATISWSGTASGYQVYMKTLNGTSWNSYSPTGTSFTTPTLSPNACYVMFVVNKCGGSYGYNSVIDTFCTLGACTNPLNLILSNPTCHGFTATWNAVTGATDYSVFYTRTTGTGAPTTYNYRASTNAYTVNTFGNGGNTYSVYVRSNCTSGGQSSASNIETMTTLTIGCKDDNGKGSTVLGATSSGTGNLNIYPNPNKGEFILDMTTTNTGDAAHVQILNMLGQQMSEQVVDNNNGSIHTTLNNTNLAAGVYFVKVRIGNQTHAARIVIQK